MPGRRPKQQYKARLPSLTDGIFDDLADMPQPLPGHLWPIQQPPRPRPQPQRPQRNPNHPFIKEEVPRLFKDIIRKVRFIEDWKQNQFRNSKLWNEYRNGPSEYYEDEVLINIHYEQLSDRYRIYSYFGLMLRYRLNSNESEDRFWREGEIRHYRERMNELQNLIDEVRREQLPLTNPPPFERIVNQYPPDSYEYKLKQLTQLYLRSEELYDKYYQLLDEKYLSQSDNIPKDVLLNQIKEFEDRWRFGDISNHYYDGFHYFIDLKWGDTSQHSPDSLQKLEDKYEEIQRKIALELNSRR